MRLQQRSEQLSVITSCTNHWGSAQASGLLLPIPAQPDTCEKDMP